MVFFQKTKNRKGLIVLFLLAPFFYLETQRLLYAQSQAGPNAPEKRMEKDTDNNGVIDQIALYGANGTLKSLYLDENQDGKMERVQQYENELILSMERDTDVDGHMDTVDFLAQGKRVRQVRMGPSEAIFQETLFDSAENPLLIKKDTTGNGTFDTFYHFEKGVLTSSTRDSDEDNRIDTLISYTKEGVAEKSQHDANQDGEYDTFRFYEKGRVTKEERDVDGDGRIDYLRTYDAQGALHTIHDEMAFSGKTDRVRLFDKGVLAKMEEDTNRDGHFESLSWFKNGKITRQEKDENQDRKTDFWIFYNDRQEKERIEIDTNRDGKKDLFQFYEKEEIRRLEKDENQDGAIDLRVFYQKGVKTTIATDTDFDGFFETTERLNAPEWGRIVERDLNKDGHPDSSFYFTAGVLRMKAIDENLDGKIDLKAIYSDKGKLVESQEDDGASGTLNLTWRYDENETPIQAGKDGNGDGRPDTWFFYEKGRLSRVEEDTNQDGRPDLFEHYDRSEALVKKEKDLNFDGVTDVTESEKHAPDTQGVMDNSNT